MCRFKLYRTSAYVYANIEVSAHTLMIKSGETGSHTSVMPAESAVPADTDHEREFLISHFCAIAILSNFELKQHLELGAEI